MYYIRHIQNSGISSTLFFHITLCNPLYSQPSHILSPGIFRIRSLFKTLWNVDQEYSEPCHGALFSHIQAYPEPCTLLAWCRNLTYLQSWNIQYASIIASWCIYQTLSYLRKFTNIQNSDMFKTGHIFRTLSKI